jgi:hypothetical protein
MKPIAVGNYVQLTTPVGGVWAKVVHLFDNCPLLFVHIVGSDMPMKVRTSSVIQVLTEEQFRDRRAGLGPIHTGSWDPFLADAQAHDDEMQKQIDGLPHDRPIHYTAKFVRNVAITTAKGVYAVIFGIPYAVVGGIVGLIRGNSRLTREEIDRED